MAGRKGIPHSVPRKGTCPVCGKKGVGQEKMISSPGIGVCCIRTCRYCRAEGKRWYRDGTFTELKWE